jgi:hypothetical protein
MDRVMKLVAVLALVSSLGVRAEEAAAPVAAAKEIAFVRVGDVDEALFGKIVEFVQMNSAIPVRVLPAAPAAGGALDEEARAAAKLIGDDVVGLVAMIAPADPVGTHGVFLPDIRVAVVNVPALKPEDNDAEKHSRRLEREAMQSLGMLLGVPSCPNPQCAMWPYQTDEDLDMKGRNYCPPCLEKIQKAAKEKGLTLNYESPFAMN